MRLWLVVVAAGCFDPIPHLGQPCTSWCPPPQACIAGTCESAGPSDGGSGSGSGSGPANVNYMFVTSTKKLPGDIGGLDGGDACCNSLAQSAGLPGTYRAWLSDGANAIGAKERIFETGARGWVRPDGKPFADTIDDITSGRLYYPPRITEQGVDVGSSGDDVVATGTFSTGDDIGLDADCEAFTDSGSADAMIAGYADGGAGAWTDYFFQVSCATQARIYCFGITEQGPVTVPPAEPSRLAFVAPAPLGSGKAGLDATCSAAATAAGATGTFAAWIATTTSVPTTPSGPWRRADNVIVMTADQQMTATLDQKADGSPGALSAAWTGSTTPTQMAATAAASCNDWTSAAQSLIGTAGITARSVLPGAWGGSDAVSCEGPAAVYCVEQ
jgi:hypothetical protein